MPLILYGRHTSYNVQKVLWLLDEIELAYEHIELGSQPEDTETEAFGQLNPMRKVPVLVDNDKTIWESNTVLRYLARRYGAKDWHFGSDYETSLIERWMDWAQTRFEPAFVGVFWGYYRTPEPKRDMDAVKNSIDECLFCLDKINHQLSVKPFLLGDKLTLADIANAIFLYRLANIDLEIAFPENVNRWYQNLQSFKGFQKWGMSNFSSLKGRLQY